MGLKRIAEKSRESRKKRKTNKLILIICEGKDTETEYFENFNSKYTKVQVKIADKSSKGKNKGKATDPENLVKKAVQFKKDYEIEEKNGDRVWCVFDIDINYNNNNNAMQSKINEIQKAKLKSDKNKIRLGMSNPCFELWYLLHFEYTTATMKSYSDVQKKLSKYIKDYDKTKDVYYLLKDRIDTAVKNSKKLKKHFEDLSKKLVDSEENYTNINIKDFVDSNPYTNINTLIEFMEDIENN